MNLAVHSLVAVMGAGVAYLGLVFLLACISRGGDVLAMLSALLVLIVGATLAAVGIGLAYQRVNSARRIARHATQMGD